MAMANAFPKGKEKKKGGGVKMSIEGKSVWCDNQLQIKAFYLFFLYIMINIHQAKPSK
jgi:hypothetical protein